MLDQNAFTESPELTKCLEQLDKTAEGYYKVSSLPELAGVLRKLQKEKARQNGLPEEPRKAKKKERPKIVTSQMKKER